MTNSATVLSGVRRLGEIERWERDGTIGRYSKKERARLAREKRRLLQHLDGLRTMLRRPAALVIVDPPRESIALAEARKIRAATVAIGDAPNVDVAIPASGNAVRAVLADLVDTVTQVRQHAKPAAPPPAESRKRRKPRPPDDEGPGTAGIPARLRPRPPPWRAAARPDRD